MQQFDIRKLKVAGNIISDIRDMHNSIARCHPVNKSNKAELRRHADALNEVLRAIAYLASLDEIAKQNLIALKSEVA